MLRGEHSAILLTVINLLPFASKIFVLSIFEWPFYTDFTVSFIFVIMLFHFFPERSKDLQLCEFRITRRL